MEEHIIIKALTEEVIMEEDTIIKALTEEFTIDKDIAESLTVIED